MSNFKDFVENTYIPKMKLRWKSETLNQYRKNIRNHLYPTFGDKALDAITESEITEFFDDMYTCSELSVTTVDALRTHMKKIFNYAIRLHFVSASPMLNYVRPNMRKETAAVKNTIVRTSYTDEEIEQIFSAIPEGSACYLPAMLSLYAGLRKGEAFGVAWQDIDFEQHILYVTRQLIIVDKNYEYTQNQLKLIEKHPSLQSEHLATDSLKYNSRRIIPLDPKLERALRKAYERQMRNRHLYGRHYHRYHYTKLADPRFDRRTPDNFYAVKLGDSAAYENGIINEIGVGYAIDFVNVRDDGELIPPRATQDISRRIHMTGINDEFNFHSLRHTFATNKYAEGIDIGGVSKLMGHDSIATTDRYLHFTGKEFENTYKLMRREADPVAEAVSTIARMKLSYADIMRLAVTLQAS